MILGDPPDLTEKLLYTTFGYSAQVDLTDGPNSSESYYASIMHKKYITYLNSYVCPFMERLNIIGYKYTLRSYTLAKIESSRRLIN